jgi:O-antigen ligase
MLTTKTTTLITYVAHFFRQTRSRIITLTIVSIVLLFWKKQYKFAISVLLFLFLIAFLFQTYAKSNFFLHPYLSAKNDITKVEGTWRGRIRQIKIDLEEFRKHPLIGSGSSVLRSNTEIYKGKDIHEIEHLMNLAYSDDLGYTHWIKHFGLIGVLIIILYFWSLFRKGLYVLKKCDEDSKKAATFSVLYLLFTCISFVTLNHFEIHHLIILNCLNAAIIVRSEYFLE